MMVSHEEADTFGEATFKATRKTSALVDEASADSVPSCEHSLPIPVLAMYYWKGRGFSTARRPLLKKRCDT